MPEESLKEILAGSPLPEYSEPPLEEVALGIQFEPIRQFTSAHAGLFWARVRDRFPIVEEQPPLPHQKEQIESPAPGGMQVLQMQMQMQMRQMYLSADRNHLLQLQKDHLIRNWKKVVGQEVYPRYTQVRDELRRDWREFVAFAKSENLGDIVADQCELTYVNHVEKGAGWDGIADIGKVFSFIRPMNRSGLLVAPETIVWNGTFKLPDNRGRLHVVMSPAFRARDFKMVLVLTLQARGAPLGGGEGDVFTWLDAAHEWLVKAFDDLTEPAMHAFWKKLP